MNRYNHALYKRLRFTGHRMTWHAADSDRYIPIVRRGTSRAVIARFKREARLVRPNIPPFVWKRIERDWRPV